MKKYNKLVRDRIPEIIEKDNEKAVYRTLSEGEYITELDKKLIEEVYEYQEDKNLEELADIMEVLYSICTARGYTVEELEAKRKEKEDTRGGFQEKIFLEYVEDSAPSNTGTISDLIALKKWRQLSEKHKEMFLNNVYCQSCGVTTIVDYCMKDDRFGILLQGKCAKCGGAVARLVEDI